MQTIDEMLASYTDETPEFNPVPQLAEIVQLKHQSIVISDRYNLTGDIQFVVKDMEKEENRRSPGKAGYAFYLHIPDRELNRESNKYFRGALEGIPLTNYNWHALYLNIFAFISEKPVGRLCLMHLHECALHHIIYNQIFIKKIVENHVQQTPAPVPVANSEDVYSRVRKNQQTSF